MSNRNLADFTRSINDSGDVESDGLSTGLQNELVSVDELLATVDSAYVNSKVDRSLFLDSNEAIQLIDSAYVQARQNFIDEPTIKSIIDSSYLDSVIGYKYMDSIETVSLVDSTYVQNRVDFTGYATEVYVDSNISVAVSALVNGADASFDTLKEIQDAMATD